MIYDPGTAVVMEAAEYRNDAGVLVNPADVVLYYRRPDGSEVTKPKADLANPAAGTFSFEVIADQVGDWLYRFTATTPTVVDEHAFTVAPLASAGDPLLPTSGPCEPWATITLVTTGWTPPELATDALIGLCLDAASDLLFQRCGRRFPGICSDVVEPAPARACIMPMAEGGEVSLWSGHGGSYLRGDGRSVELGSYPVRQILEVLIDGVALAPAAYRVMDNKRLVRIDGGTWPANTIESTDAPHLEVGFTFGELPPPSGVLAAVELTRELVKALVKAEGCALDRRVQTLNREGVTITIPGLVDSLRDGRTGIPAVDLFLWSHNPNGLQNRGRILMPWKGAAGASRRTFG